jgi:DNA-binding transcriptional ArsR family regulator
MVDKVFAALASESRRQILAYLATDELTAGEIAARFSMSKPAISKHLQLLEAAGLVTSDKRGQYVWYSLEREALTGAMAHFLNMLGADTAVTFARPAGGPPPPSRAASRPDRPRDRA